MSNRVLAISIEGLNIQYPGASEKALKDLYLSVPEGAFFGLLGPNGAGKTSLISFLCGQVNGEYKKSEVLGVPRSDIISYKKKIGYAPQEIALYPTLTAEENLIFFARLMKVSKDEVVRVLNWVGLSDRKKMPVKNFSGGMKRRLNLGVALLNRPQLLILDEPTVGIDPESRNFIFEKLLELKKEGVTLLYSTHYLEEVKKICDHTGILLSGKMLIQGTRDEVFGKNDLEERYLQLTGGDS